MAYKYLDLTACQTIEALYLADNDATQIAEALGVHRSTIYRELQRGATGEIDQNLRPGYSATVAEQRLRASFKRRGKKLDG